MLRWFERFSYEISKMSDAKSWGGKIRVAKIGGKSPGLKEFTPTSAKERGKPAVTKQNTKKGLSSACLVFISKADAKGRKGELELS